MALSIMVVLLLCIKQLCELLSTKLDNKKYDVVQTGATFLMLIYEQMSNKKVVINK